MAPEWSFGERCSAKRRRVMLWTAMLCLLALPLGLQTAPSDVQSTGRGAPTRIKREFIEDSMQRYLMDFGYLPQSDLETGNLRTESQLREAISQLQKFAGLKPTGKVDAETKKLISKPRCGVSDFVNEESRRKKRYALRGPKWGYTNLTWRLREPPNPKLLDPGAVRRELKEALDVWSENSRLTFQMVNHDDADIDIEFSRGYHGDGFPFDGRGKILAHAFFPGTGRGGDAHFDDEELWLVQNEDVEEGTSLFSVAAHEFGHSLGLSHSSVEGALMYPWYQGTRNAHGKFQLPDDDRYGIEQLYGRKTERPQPTRPPKPHFPTTASPPHRHTPPTYRPPPDRPQRPERPLPPKQDEKPNTCDTNYDAISLIRGELFIFKGRYFWRLNKEHMREGYPVEISRFWYGLPDNFTHIDAVYERLDKKIVFFIGKQYYVYEANIMAYGYPKPLTYLGLPDTLEKVDGAMIWGHNSKTYFFSGTMYWRLEDQTGRVELDYPRDMKMWGGVGYNIDCVFKYHDGITYFFKGKGFWKFNDEKMRVDKKGQLSSASYWMRCPVEEERELPDYPSVSSRTFSICVSPHVYIFICIYEVLKFVRVTTSGILVAWK